VSGAGTASKPKYRFCWACSRQLQGNFHRVAIIEGGHEVPVHAECAELDGLTIKSGAHLKRGREEAGDG
jgi:hypothetical protein